MRTQQGVNLRGLEGKGIIAYLVRLCEGLPGIAEMNFASYEPLMGLDERLRETCSERERRLIDLADTEYRSSGIPFSTALIILGMRTGKLPSRFLDAAGLHVHGPLTRSYVLHRSDVSEKGIRALISALPARYGLVVSSKVRLASGFTAQLPMLDLLCPCSAHNMATVRAVIRRTGQAGGVLVESGNSYHFYGTALLDTEEWTRFMARALLFAPVTDPRYIAHRIFDGECRLKVAGVAPQHKEPVIAALL